MKSKIFVVIVICLNALACGDKKFSLNSDLDNAIWIGDLKKLPQADSLFYIDDPAPLFRKEFKVRENIKSAKLYVTAAGYYSVLINDKKLGNNFCDPAWTNYSKRIYYSEYNLENEIQSGINCLGVTLGNGFYNPLPMRMWGWLNLREHIPTGRPVFIAKIKLEYQDGTSDEVCTDKTWKFAYGPIIRNNVYLGELYDARKEIKGWSSTGFDAENWENALETNSPTLILQKSFFPPMQISSVKKPVNISTIEKGVYIVDMGENFTGLYKLRIRGSAGDTIRLRFGERLYTDGRLNPNTSACGQIKSKRVSGGPGCPENAWQTDSYVIGDTSEVYYTPSFTYHIYRYMEIRGLKQAPPVNGVEGYAINTNVENKNSFSCSSELLNSIQKACVRTFLNNLISVQSDCSGRERFGYGGDLTVTSESFISNFSMQTFYRKTIYDWVDAINDSTFIDTAPYVGIKYCGLQWESAFLTTQYDLFLYYNDRSVVRELYNFNLKWMDKAADKFPSGLVNSGLSDHEALVTVPVELIGTSRYLICARIMKKFAELMNDKSRIESFSALEHQITLQLLDNFWKNRFKAKIINGQTLFSALLFLDIIPENQKTQAVDSLLNAVERVPSGHFTTGIFGTRYILDALSAAGNTDLVFDIVNSTSWPGWGYMIDRGATTIWETWKESDDTFSNSHPMFGVVSEWFYKWLGGIQPDPEFPGFKRFFIKPHLPEGLNYVKCNYESPFGMIVSNLERRDQDTCIFNLKIPEHSSAIVNIPVERDQSYVIKNASDKVIKVKENRLCRCFELKAGEYRIYTY